MMIICLEKGSLIILVVFIILCFHAWFMTKIMKQELKLNLVSWLCLRLVWKGQYAYILFLDFSFLILSYINEIPIFIGIWTIIFLI